MNGLKLMVNVIISAVVLLFVVRCSTRPRCTPQAAQPSRTVTLPPHLEMSEEIREIAWKAYSQATGLNILAEESPVVVSEFTLFREVQGLGKKGDKIHEVRFAIFGGSQTRGLILVNEKTKESLVVFPKKKASAQENSPDKK
ncbi:MAG: hypothetical protein ACYTFW_07515 [Planctomycetota bacterium]|jgi:hypothetical protein